MQLGQDHLFISAHTPALSQRKKILYTFLIWSADSGCSLSSSCEHQIVLSCCIPAREPKICSLHPLDHGLKVVVSLETHRLPSDHATQGHHSEKQFSYLHFFHFPATPLLFSTISSCPRRRFQDRNTLHIPKTVHDFGKWKIYPFYTETKIIFCKELSFTKFPVFSL